MAVALTGGCRQECLLAYLCVEPLCLTSSHGEKIRQTRETVEKRGHAFSGFIPVFAADGIDRFPVCPHVVVVAIQECMNYSDII